MTARSSGDALADRRHAYAMEYRAAGEVVAAAELMAQALERAPGWAAGWVSLGELHEAAGAGGPAAEAYRQAAGLDPADEAGARARLARLGHGEEDGAVTPAHVAALFDDYAPRFEAALLGPLAYRGPALLAEAIEAVAPGRRFGHAIDLGCGTGLMAEALAGRCEAIMGVDLSAGMLAVSAGKGLYAGLERAEAVAFLSAQAGGSADLVVAADVLVYLGDLGELFRQAARVLAPGGLFAFTVQTAPQDPAPFALGADLRYAHSEPALRAWATSAGLSAAHLAPASTRLDAGRPVPGLVAVLAAP